MNPRNDSYAGNGSLAVTGSHTFGRILHVLYSVIDQKPEGFYSLPK
jgi:hypothetical protein